MDAPRQGHDLGILLALAYQRFVEELHRDLDARGLGGVGRSDGYVFRALDEGPLTVSALAARLSVTKQAAAQIVADMEARGLLLKRPDPDDGRARLLALTDRGRKVYAAARAFHRTFEERLVRELGDAPVAGLVATLEHVAGEEPLRDPRIRALYL